MGSSFSVDPNRPWVPYLKSYEEICMILGTPRLKAAYLSLIPVHEYDEYEEEYQAQDSGDDLSNPFHDVDVLNPVSEDVALQPWDIEEVAPVKLRLPVNSKSHYSVPHPVIAAPPEPPPVPEPPRADVTPHLGAQRDLGRRVLPRPWHGMQPEYPVSCILQPHVGNQVHDQEEGTKTKSSQVEKEF
jgi:hypothetical protein